jgi:3-phenylpropionate/trans-cinnamate dioxygenase ferredoxin subunit
LLPEGYGREFVMATVEPELPGKKERVEISSPRWTYALDDAALPEGHTAPAYPLGLNVLLARVSGTVYGVSGKCAHMACPLSAGRLEGFTIVCSCHDWRFDVRTGRFLDAEELGLTVYAVKLEAGKLFVNLG